MPENITLTQQVQVGVETTSGTPPGGGSAKLFTGLDVMIDPDFQAQQYRASGHRFDTLSVPTLESAKIKGDGPLTYTELVYPASGVWGAATITTPAGGVNARKWGWGVGLTGTLGGKTFQLQKGDVNYARQVNFAQWHDLALDLSRKDSKVSAAGIAQQIQDNITLTASPTAIGLVPVQPKEWNVYLDTSSANIGVTQLLRCYNGKPSYTGGYAGNWPMNRANASFATVVDTAPKVELTLSAMADGNIGALWAIARAAGKVYVRLAAVSTLLVDNYDVLTISGAPTGGTFTLTYKGQTTTAIAFNAASSAVQAALQALPTIGASGCTVAGSAGGPYTVTMTGALASDATAFTHTDSFTGGTTPALAIVQTTVPYSLTYDLACVPIPQSYKDDAGAWVQEVKFAVVEDPTWIEAGASGTAINMSLVNNLTGL